MTNNGDLLENEALRMLLDGDDVILAILRQQLSHIKSVRREYTGAGSYSTFTLEPDSPRIPGSPSFAFGDVVCQVEGVETGGGFLLFVNDGLLDVLETYSFDDSWPERIGEFTIRYVRDEGRGLEAIRRTPGWPHAQIGEG